MKLKVLAVKPEPLLREDVYRVLVEEDGERVTYLVSCKKPDGSLGDMNDALTTFIREKAKEEGVILDSDLTLRGRIKGRKKAKMPLGERLIILNGWFASVLPLGEAMLFREHWAVYLAISIGFVVLISIVETSFEKK